MYFSVVHPDMAVYIRIVPILEKLRTVLMPQLPYIGHGSLKKIFSHKGFRFFLENLGQSTKALALYSPQFFQNWDKYLQYFLDLFFQQKIVLFLLCGPFLFLLTQFLLFLDVQFADPRGATQGEWGGMWMRLSLRGCWKTGIQGWMW